jgi:hypothetical protein
LTPRKCFYSPLKSSKKSAFKDFYLFFWFNFFHFLSLSFPVSKFIYCFLWSSFRELISIIFLCFTTNNHSMYWSSHSSARFHLLFTFHHFIENFSNLIIFHLVWIQQIVSEIASVWYFDIKLIEKNSFLHVFIIALLETKFLKLLNFF